MKKWITFLVALVVTTGASTAQPEDQLAGRGGLSVIAAVPQGSFADLDAMPIGLAVTFGGRIPGSPVILGTELGVLGYGRQESLRLHGAEISFPGARADVPLGVVRTGSSHHILMGHLVARLQPSTGIFQPYVEALAGLRYFATATHVAGDFIFRGDGFRDRTSAGDTALSFGVGGGAEIAVYSGPMGWDDRRTTVSLDAGIRYLVGTEATYLRESLDNGLAFDSRTSRTDMLVPQFGLRLRR